MYSIDVWGVGSDPVAADKEGTGSDDTNFPSSGRLRAYSWMLGCTWGFWNATWTSVVAVTAVAAGDNTQQLSGEWCGSRHEAKAWAENWRLTYMLWLKGCDWYMLQWVSVPCEWSVGLQPAAWTSSQVSFQTDEEELPDEPISHNINVC